MKKIGILTAGSDSPGLNAAIRAIGKTANNLFECELIGFQDGFQGLVEDRTLAIESAKLSGILTSGGTMLGTSSDKPDQMDINGTFQDLTDQAVATYKKHHLDVLVCLGGNDTQEIVYKLSQKGLNIISLPKAINNDVVATDMTIGFDTAMSVASEAIDRLHSTAYSHHRIIIVELMGHHAGWLTLGAGIAGGADVILIPEIPYDTKIVADAILKRNAAGKRFSIVAVSEGALTKETSQFHAENRSMNQRLRQGEEFSKAQERITEIENRYNDNTALLADRLNKFTGLVTRTTILGYLLRGGIPSAADRLLATQLGSACARMIQENHYGVMVAIQNGQMVPVPLGKVAGLYKLIPENHEWIISARNVGTCFGDE